jgi:hypothetical protein
LLSDLTSVDPHTYGYRVKSYDGIDAGDGRFEYGHCYSTVSTWTAVDTAFQFENGGGLQIIGSKIGGGPVGLNIPWLQFSDVVIDHCSFEAIGKIAINIVVQPGLSLGNFHITKNQMITSTGGLYAIVLDATAAGSNIQNGIIDGNIIQGPAAAADTGILIKGNVSNVIVGRNHTFTNIATPVYSSSTGTPKPIIDIPPQVQAVTEAATMNVDLHKGTYITMSLTANTDILNIINSGPGVEFTMQIGTNSTTNNLVCGSGSFNYTGTNAFNVGLTPSATNIVHCTMVDNTHYIVNSVQHQWSAGSVAFANGAVTGDALFNYQQTTQRLGIGVASPLYAFHQIRGDAVSGFADQTNAWTKTFNNNGDLTNTNVMRLLSSGGTVASPISANVGQMNAYEFGYRDSAGNYRVSAGLFSRAEAIPSNTNGTMPTKVGIATYNVAQALTLRENPFVTGNVRDVWFSNGQHVSGILIPSDTVAQGNFTQTIRGSTWLGDDSVFIPNIPQNVLDTTATKLMVRDGSGRTYWTNWPTFGSSPGGSNTQIQFNNSGSFGGSANLTWASNILTATGMAITTLVNANANDSVVMWNPSTKQLEMRSATLNLYAANGATLTATDTINAFTGALNQISAVAGAGFPLSLGTSGSNLGQFNIYSPSIFLRGSTSFAGGNPTNANLTVGDEGMLYLLPNISANRTITLPSVSNYFCRILVFANNNTTTAFNWSFSSSVANPGGSPITTLQNGATYILQSHGSNGWTIISKSDGAMAPIETGVATFNLGVTSQIAYDYVFTGSTTTWTLPDRAGSIGKRIYIKNAGSGNITLNTAGSDLIYDTSSGSSITIAPGASRIIVASASSWYVE